jgi:hypothetical protein
MMDDSFDTPDTLSDDSLSHNHSPDFPGHEGSPHRHTHHGLDLPPIDSDDLTPRRTKESPRGKLKYLVAIFLCVAAFLMLLIFISRILGRVT